MSGTPIAGDYIKAEGKAGRMGARLMAIVAEGERGRVYLSPTPGDRGRCASAGEAGVEAGCRALPDDRTGGFCAAIRADQFGDLFTPRQLVALTTFSDLVQEARERVKRDALARACPTTASISPLAAPVLRPTPKRSRVSGFARQQAGRSHSTLCTLGYEPDRTARRCGNTFGRQAFHDVGFRRSKSLHASVGKLRQLV